MKDFFNQLLYFLIAILLIGTIGIWLPPLIENSSDSTTVDVFEVYKNVTTYYICIVVAGCLNLILKILDTNVSNKKGYILLFVLILFLSIGSVVANSFLIFHENEVAKIVAIAGVGFSWLLWWISNWKDGITNAENALGGQV